MLQGPVQRTYAVPWRWFRLILHFNQLQVEVGLTEEMRQRILNYTISSICFVFIFVFLPTIEHNVWMSYKTNVWWVITKMSPML